MRWSLTSGVDVCLGIALCGISFIISPAMAQKICDPLNEGLIVGCQIIPPHLVQPGPPSFSCLTRLGADEAAICRNSTLSYLDRQMASQYFMLRDNLDFDSQTRLRDEQRNWLRRRAGCGGAESCLSAVYTSRIDQLQNWQ
jgi:uncharacterized protein